MVSGARRGGDGAPLRGRGVRVWVRGGGEAGLMWDGTNQRHVPWRGPDTVGYVGGGRSRSGGSGVRQRLGW
jgi:hypothetical protein